MANKLFTEEEMEILRSNPYTYKVFPNQIKFSRKFKELYLEEFEINGLTNKEILLKYGYDPEILGSPRCRRLSTLFKEQLDPERSTRKRESKKEEIQEVTPKTIQELQQKVDYLEQEIDFLKKISAVRTLKQ